MFKLVINAYPPSGTKFNYALMNVNTGMCFGFYTLDDISYCIPSLKRGICWKPTSYTELSTEFSTLSDLKQVLPELFI